MSLFDEMLRGAALDDLIRVHGQTLTIQRNTPVDDEYGSQTDDWNDIAGLTDLPGHFYTLSGREVARMQKMEVDASHGFLCRTATVITEKDRGVKGDRIFDIQFVEREFDGECVRLFLRERK